MSSPSQPATGTQAVETRPEGAGPTAPAPANQERPRGRRRLGRLFVFAAVAVGVAAAAYFLDPWVRRRHDDGLDRRCLRQLARHPRGAPDHGERGRGPRRRQRLRAQGGPADRPRRRDVEAPRSPGPVRPPDRPEDARSGDRQGEIGGLGRPGQPLQARLDDVRREEPGRRTPGRGRPAQRGEGRRAAGEAGGRALQRAGQAQVGDAGAGRHPSDRLRAGPGAGPPGPGGDPPRPRGPGTPRGAGAGRRPRGGPARPGADPLERTRRPGGTGGQPVGPRRAAAQASTTPPISSSPTSARRRRTGTWTPSSSRPFPRPRTSRPPGRRSSRPGTSWPRRS